jgi:hypothetical protein
VYLSFVSKVTFFILVIFVLPGLLLVWPSGLQDHLSSSQLFVFLVFLFLFDYLPVGKEVTVS